MSNEATTLHWPRSHVQFAKRQGWRIQLTSGTNFRNPTSPGDLYHYARIRALIGGKSPRFKNDEQALAFVHRRADEGSLFHRRALAYIASKAITDDFT